MSKTVATLNAPAAPINIRDGFTSITGDDMESKKRVFNAIATAEKLADNLEKQINAIDILVQPRTTEADEKTGEMDDYLSITILDADGTAYTAGSKGLANSIENVLAIFGHPASWDEPLAMKAVERKAAKGKYFAIELL